MAFTAAVRRPEGGMSLYALGRSLRARASSSADLESLLQDLPGMVYRCRNDRQWTMEFVSVRSRELCGYGPEDLIANRRVSWAEVIHADDRPWVRREVQRAVREGSPFQLEYRIVHADGEVRWVWEQGHALPAGGGTPACLLGYIQDVSAVKTMESDLGAQRAMFKALVENLQDTFSVLSPDGNVIYTSPSIERVLGYAPDERTHRNVLELVHPDDLERARDALRRAAGAGRDETVSIELRALARDGEWRHVDVRSQNLLEDPHVGGITIVVRDVTEGRRAQEAESRQQREFTALVEQSPDLIVRLDGDFRIAYVNPVIEKLQGCERSFFLGRDVRDIGLSAEMVEESVRACRRALETGEQQSLETALSTPAGVRHFETRVVPERDEHGEISGILSIARDITERKSLERQLRQAQKLEALGRLAGGIAHDFNNFLTAIVGFAHLLRARCAGDEQSLAFVAEIEGAAQSSCRLTDQLLAFSRSPRPAAPASVDLNGLVNSLRKMLDRVIGEDVEVRLELSQERPVVRGEKAQLEQVIMNLVINARDAMPQGGLLTIGTELRAVLETVQEAVLPVGQGPFAVLSVSDNGTGIEDTILDRVFDPFFTTKDANRGTGLGLSTVYGIVQQHGGTVRVDTVPGDGTRFEVCLPVGDGQTSEPEPGALLVTPEIEEEIEERTRPIRVLVVEDSDPVRQVATVSLSRAGMTVLSARNAAEARSRCRDLEEPIDVLLTDMVLPEGNGLELAAEIAQLVPPIRVVLMSGYAQKELPSGSWIPEAAGWLDKPFTPAEVVAVVRRAVAAASQ